MRRACSYTKGDMAREKGGSQIEEVVLLLTRRTNKCHTHTTLYITSFKKDKSHEAFFFDLSQNMSIKQRTRSAWEQGYPC